MSSIKNDYIDIELRNRGNGDVDLLINDIEDLHLELNGANELYTELEDKTSGILETLKRAGINDDGDLKVFILAVEALIDNRPDHNENEPPALQDCFDALEESFDYTPAFNKRNAPIVPGQFDQLENILNGIGRQAKNLAQFKPVYAQRAANTLNAIMESVNVEIVKLKGDK